MSISGNMVGSYSQIGKTFIIVNEDGEEVSAVVVDQDVVFTATDSDVAKGKVYASDSGVSTGTNEIPLYIYALIDGTGLCNEVRGTSKNCYDMEGYIVIPQYSSSYIDKYYNVNDEKWYLDASFVTEFVSK